MAAPTRARGCSFSCQDIFKFTLLFGVVVIAGLVVTGFIELRDLQDRLGWTPSDKQLYVENILLREQVKTLKKEKVALEHKFQKLEEQLKTTTAEKNELLVDATICANSSWSSVISAMLIGVLLWPIVNFCCYCLRLHRRDRQGGAVVAFQD